MKKKIFFLLFLVPALLSRGADADEVKDLSKDCEKVSKFMPLLDNPPKDLNNMIYYQWGWNGKKPATINVQFRNLGYGDHKIKFTIKDVAAKKLVVLDPVRNSNFGSETLKPDSKGAIWSGKVSNIKDGFSLSVWDGGDGEAVVKKPISLGDLK